VLEEDVSGDRSILVTLHRDILLNQRQYEYTLHKCRHNPVLTANGCSCCNKAESTRYEDRE
jgi:hypothetical protein